MKLEDVKRRVARLERLPMGLAREIQLMGKGNDPLLYLERKAYLYTIGDALAGVEAARVTLAKARLRLERLAGEIG